jgi:hypothetical protein
VKRVLLCHPGDPSITDWVTSRKDIDLMLPDLPDVPGQFSEE